MANKNFIKDFWEDQAEKHKDSHCASWGDNWMIDLETDLISQHIKDNQQVLDVGCANGYSAFKQVEKNPKIKIVGVDFADKMIKYAQEAKEKRCKNKPIEFSVGDILDLKFLDNSFDVAYTTRVLINLPNWEEQKRGIKELLRVVKPGGKVILLEAFWEPLILLNSLRALKNLPPLEVHDFNRYLSFDKIDAFLKKEAVNFERKDFSSIYYFGSRFLRDLVTDAEKYEGFSNPINKIFYEIEKEFSGGGFGIQQAYILEVKK
jgi:ubiquinone/menaquinone biosynthesis C-methylase UbiE